MLKHVVRNFAILVTVVLFGALPFAYTASAWQCQPGFSDTPENQHAGMCVEVTPTPFHHATETSVSHTPTDVPPVAHSTETPATETPVPNHAPASMPTSVTQPAPQPASFAPNQSSSPSGAPTQTVQVCHYESTQGWLLETKAPFSGFNELTFGPSSTSPLSDYRPVGGVCAAPATPTAAPTLAPVTPVSVATVAPAEAPVPSHELPTATPTAVATAVEVPTAVSTAVPAPMSPPVQMPAALPQTGDGSTADELVP